MSDRKKWVDESVRAVVSSLLKHVRDYDEAHLTMDMLHDQVKSDVHHAITGSYDAGFQDGLNIQPDDEEDGDTQLEFDLDALRELGKDEDDEDED